MNELLQIVQERIERDRELSLAEELKMADEVREQAEIFLFNIADVPFGWVQCDRLECAVTIKKNHQMQINLVNPETRVTAGWVIAQNVDHDDDTCSTHFELVYVKDREFYPIKTASDVKNCLA